MNLEPLLANLQQVAIDAEFSSFYARRLAAKMGLTGELIPSVSHIIENMYRLFIAKDLESIEINPLGVNSQGKLMALDGKITVNDSALGRHPDIISLINLDRQAVSALCAQSPQQRLHQSNLRWLNWQEPNDKIGIISNSFDSILLVWDSLCQSKVQPACGVVIEPEPNATKVDTRQLELSLNELVSSNKIQVILVNIWETVITSSEIVQAIASCYGKQGQLLSEASSIKFVLRLLNCENVEALHHVIPTGTIYLTTSLEETISRTIALVGK